MLDDDRKKVVIALGYFDSVHLGHRKVISESIRLAKEKSASAVVFTFKGNLKAMLTGEKEKCVYNVQEREKLLMGLGIDEIYFAPVDFSFLSLGKLAFLNKTNKKYDIIGYVCGADYKFGKFASGDVDDLKRYADGKDQIVLVVDEVVDDGKKISTTLIKKLLANGEVKRARKLLGRSFSVSGEVREDRGVGTTIGCPTANLKIAKDKQPVKDGVYAGRVLVENEMYNAVINYGPRPTFDISDKMLEAHLLNFEGNLYGKEITVFFDDYIREIQKFVSAEKLKEQLEHDIQEVGEGKYLVVDGENI